MQCNGESAADGVLNVGCGQAIDQCEKLFDKIGNGLLPLRQVFIQPEPDIQASGRILLHLPVAGQQYRGVTRHALVLLCETGYSKSQNRPADCGSSINSL